MSQLGPCNLCGATNYPNSLGGPFICPSVERKKLPPLPVSFLSVNPAPNASAGPWPTPMVVAYTGDQMREYALAALGGVPRALLASPPIPAGQEVRMLTYTELTAAVPSAHRMDDEDWTAIQIKFCEVNGLKLAPATTKEK